VIRSIDTDNGDSIEFVYDGDGRMFFIQHRSMRHVSGTDRSIPVRSILWQPGRESRKLSDIRAAAALLRIPLPDELNAA
jgi:hypothetical protein